jgi:hypothetical protein
VAKIVSQIPTIIHTLMPLYDVGSPLAIMWAWHDATDVSEKGRFFMALN